MAVCIHLWIHLAGGSLESVGNKLGWSYLVALLPLFQSGGGWKKKRLNMFIDVHSNIVFSPCLMSLKTLVACPGATGSGWKNLGIWSAGGEWKLGFALNVWQRQHQAPMWCLIRWINNIFWLTVSHIRSYDCSTLQDLCMPHHSSESAEVPWHRCICRDSSAQSGWVS